MIWLLLVNLLVLFIALRGICYAADQIEKLRGEMLDVMKDVLENNKRASNDTKALLAFYEQVCEECKKGDMHE